MIPVEHNVDPGAKSGRGLVLVSSLATSWGFESNGSRKLIWVELAIPR
jgi:hypothetical protein